MSSPSPVKLSKAQELKISQATDPHAIAEMVRGFAVENGVAARDSDPRGDSNLLYEVPADQRPPEMLSKTITVNGKTYEISASAAEGEAGLARAEAEVYRSIITPVEQPRDPDSGRFTSTLSARTPEDVARIAELRGQLIRGEIDAEFFLQASGEFDRAAETREQKRAWDVGKQIVDGWASASEAFKRGEGRDWPGEVAMPRMQELLIERGYSESPSVEALNECWQIMRDESATESAEARIAEAQSPDAVLEALGRDKYRDVR
jgi:hypothetical protein